MFHTDRCITLPSVPLFSERKEEQHMVEGKITFRCLAVLLGFATVVPSNLCQG